MAVLEEWDTRAASRGLFTRVGTSLFGAQFRPQLAAALGVSLRQVQRWCAGSEDVPQWAWCEVAEMLERRREELAALHVECSTLALR